ncbi:hypothetical protein QVD17_38368 [Tagetes erecta]|uniref:Protein FAR1-RELATED SEQUENCE n=1 Tax=Tagetes erecta TaxID=13708 RepID=A0AAD8JLL9_TARER|nr:hypothetical protein QVD17_38368 [Tagetes erecta]
MDDAAGTDFSTYKEIGIELVSPSTGIKYYKPVANSSSKPVVGMCFDSVDEAFEFYKQYGRSSDMMLKRLLNKMEFLPNFTCHYTIKEDGRLGNLFWADEEAKRNYLVGANLCGTTDFKKRLGRIVWDDSIPIDEFERQWPIILSDFNLSEHEWLGDIYNIRHDWIPAYYKDEKLSGLMRTTSRCESENHFFKKFCNRKSNLVEFLSHFDSAMEVQRLCFENQI